MNKNVILTLLVLLAVTAVAAIPKMEFVQGGKFRMGEYIEDVETEGVLVQIPAFLMSRYEVTVDEFAEFVEDTDYETSAEKAEAI